MKLGVERLLECFEKRALRRILRPKKAAGERCTLDNIFIGTPLHVSFG
jgi:hypothetical protein